VPHLHPNLTATKTMSIPTSFPTKDVSLCLHEHTEQDFLIQLQSTQHRLAIVSEWDIPKGAKVLEIGCGQGDCTAVLGELVGSEGHVTAIDPGPLDYGTSSRWFDLRGNYY
jgi:predicted methyltransferase